MIHVRIVATCDDDNGQTIVIVGFLTEERHLRPKAEAFGYVKDWTDEVKTYVRFPFILEPMDSVCAMLGWGGFDPTASEIDVLGRRLVPGERIVRREGGETWNYTIKSIVESKV